MISVIVPVYNVAAYLDRCVESIINQMYADLEIILVDDGSPDNCGEMCDEWAKKDGRIKIIHKKNGGLSDARNAGLDIATGQYIGFVDSDDWIEPDMYQDLLGAIEQENTELAVTGIKRTYDNGYSRVQFVCDTPFIITGDEIIQAYLQQGTFSTSAGDKLYLKSLFDTRRFPVGKQYEDAPVIFDILCSVSKVAVIGRPQYNYFQRADSICGQSFSIRKMDHYEFSKAIWERAKRHYPRYIEDADAFWGCKVCEILYTLYESKNQNAFQQEEKILCNDLNKVWKSVIKNDSVPKIMKVKTIMARIHVAPIYNKLKSLKVARV
ncbi:MAG: glycosyltransferase family 2 protein [Eubacteriales bacterium]|nr:glycosyltransferase family 2 protein [Eubacteriales bacterium]